MPYLFVGDWICLRGRIGECSLIRRLVMTDNENTHLSHIKVKGFKSIGELYQSH